MARLEQTKKANAALTKCYFCLKDFQILLARKYTQQGEPLTDLAPLNGKVIDMSPCNECSDHMKQGVVLLSIDNSKSDKDWHRQKMPNPYRTGGYFVLKDEAIKRIFSEKMSTWAIKHRWIFAEHEACERLGLFEQAERKREVIKCQTE